MPRKGLGFEEAASFGARLRKAMRRAGVGNQAIAAITDVHVKTVSQWLNDKQVPEEFRIDAIAERLRVPPSWLRYGTGDMVPDEFLTLNQIKEESSNGYTPSLDRRRLRPRVYSTVFEYLERMKRAGCDAEQMESAERLMVDAAYSKLYRRSRSSKSEEDQILDIDAAFRFIAEVIERTEGKKL